MKILKRLGHQSREGRRGLFTLEILTLPKNMVMNALSGVHFW